MAERRGSFNTRYQKALLTFDVLYFRYAEKDENSQWVKWEHHGFCKQCTQQALNRQITNTESQELFEAVLNRLLEVKSATQKSELDMFFR